MMPPIKDRVAGVDPKTGVAKTFKEVLSVAILLTERVRKAVEEADSFKSECADLGRQADLLADMLRAVVRRLSAIPNPYERPAHSIAVEASKALDRVLSLVHRFRHRGVFFHVVSITTGSADFRKAFALLDASLGDLRWLLSVYSSSDDHSDGGGCLILSLPPIASTNPILSWVWSCVAVVQMAARSSDRAEAATSLANLALDNDRNKKIIIEEGGVPPILALLEDRDASLDAQLAAAAAITNLASDSELVSLLVADGAVPVIVQVLAVAPMLLQACLATLVARLAARDPVAQEEFGRENVIRHLVSLVSFELPLEDTCPHSKKPVGGLLVRSHSDPMLSSAASNSNFRPNGNGVSSSRGQQCYYCRHHRKKGENESPEVKLQLKVACA